LPWPKAALPKPCALGLEKFPDPEAWLEEPAAAEGCE